MIMPQGYHVEQSQRPRFIPNIQLTERTASLGVSAWAGWALLLLLGLAGCIQAPERQELPLIDGGGGEGVAEGEGEGVVGEGEGFEGEGEGQAGEGEGEGQAGEGEGQAGEGEGEGQEGEGEGQPIPTGEEGGPCYGNGTCNAGLVCWQDERCVPIPDGEAGGRCLDGSLCLPGLECDDQFTCQPIPTGEAGGLCYGNGTCNAGLVCWQDRCQPGACQPGTFEPCPEGQDQGECERGTRRCGDDLAWGLCQGQVEPQVEVCNNRDDDCDGATDEELGVGQACSVGLGACRAEGRFGCGAQGVVVCDGVAGQPGAEFCNEVDDDCDGATDESEEVLGCEAGEVCHQGQCCAPSDCAAQGITCGPADDGCGSLLECGDCPGGFGCQAGSCGWTHSWTCGATLCPHHPLDWAVRCNLQEHCEYTPVQGLPFQEEIWVPAGRFPMGSPPDEEGDPGHDRDESPQHDVELARGFFLGKFEVTQARYGACVADRRCEPLRAGAAADHPQAYMTWSQARIFCQAQGARLLAEAEWEFAATGPVHRKYPWGDEPEADENRAVIDQQGPAPVGSKPAGASFVGALDLAGNVWEWTEDCWHDSYAGAPTDGLAWTWGCTNAMARTRRGGCFTLDAHRVRTAEREARLAANPEAETGVRCVRDLMMWQPEPATLDFGTVAVAEVSPEQVVRLHNPEQQPVAGFGLDLAGPHARDFPIVGGSCTEEGELAPGADCEIRIRFAPVWIGERLAVLRVILDDEELARIELGGTGLPHTINGIGQLADGFAPLRVPGLVSVSSSGSGVKIDSTGAVWVAGVVERIPGSWLNDPPLSDLALWKLDQVGQLAPGYPLVWPGPDGNQGTTSSRALAVTAEHIWVVGYMVDDEGKRHLALWRFEQHGELSPGFPWIRPKRLDEHSEGWDLVVDGLGDVWVTGLTRPALNAWPNGCLLLRFDPQGELDEDLPEACGQARATDHDAGSGITVAPDGRIWVVGYAHFPQDLGLWSYSSAGELGDAFPRNPDAGATSARYENCGSPRFSVDGSSLWLPCSIYRIKDGQGDWDAALWQTDPGGMTSAGFPWVFEDQLHGSMHALALDTASQIWMTGYHHWSAGAPPPSTIEFAVWQATPQGPLTIHPEANCGHFNGQGWDIEVDAAGNAWATGYCEGPEGQQMVLFKLQ